MVEKNKKMGTIGYEKNKKDDGKVRAPVFCCCGTVCSIIASLIIFAALQISLIPTITAATTFIKTDCTIITGYIGGGQVTASVKFTLKDGSEVNAR